MGNYSSSVGWPWVKFPYACGRVVGRHIVGRNRTARAGTAWVLGDSWEVRIVAVVVILVQWTGAAHWKRIAIASSLLAVEPWSTVLATHTVVVVTVTMTIRYVISWVPSLIRGRSFCLKIKSINFWACALLLPLSSRRGWALRNRDPVDSTTLSDHHSEVVRVLGGTIVRVGSDPEVTRSWIGGPSKIGIGVDIKVAITVDWELPIWVGAPSIK